MALPHATAASSSDHMEHVPALEVTLVVWDPAKLSFGDILQQFWQCHNPTQGNRQGRDKGTQVIYPPPCLMLYRALQYLG